MWLFITEDNMKKQNNPARFTVPERGLNKPAKVAIHRLPTGVRWSSRFSVPTVREDGRVVD